MRRPLLHIRVGWPRFPDGENPGAGRLAAGPPGIGSTLPVGGVSDPIVTPNATVIVKVLERQDPAPSDIQSAKATLKTELLNEHRNRFYASYMNKARERMKVNINRELIAQLVA